ncbi:MAG: hypothetical protein ACTSPB_04635, partial [Candidatus Thorarchaeota archaeon]
MVFICGLLKAEEYCAEFGAGQELDFFLYVLILPTIILIVFLETASAKILGDNHKFGLLLSIALYLVIVSQGWYGTFAMFIRGYIIIFLVLTAIIFFVGRFFGREHTAISSALGTAARQKFEDNRTRREDLRTLKIELDQLKKSKARVNGEMRKVIKRGEELEQKARSGGEMSEKEKNELRNYNNYWMTLNQQLENINKEIEKREMEIKKRQRGGVF